MLLLASRLGLGRPLRQHRPPSQATRPPRDHTQGQRALPRLQHYYEPSDSSEGIGLLFPHGLWHRLPASTDPPTGPSWTTGHPAHPGLASSCEYKRDPERSPWIISSTFSPRTAAITVESPHTLVIPSGAVAISRCLAPQEQGHRLPRSRAGRHLRRPHQRFTHVQSCSNRLRPLRTPRHRDALGIDYRTSTTKAREGLTPPD
jgi:hypothetical protein